VFSVLLLFANNSRIHLQYDMTHWRYGVEKNIL